MMKKYNGFTLIELMIVVAIIGVMSAIAYPSYSSYMKKSGRADAEVGVAKIADRLERFYLRCNTYTTSFEPMGEPACQGASGINTSTTSDEGHYRFEITPGDSGDLIDGYLITATAVFGKSQAGDTITTAGDCTVMTFDSVGRKNAPSSLDPAGTDPDVPDCW